MLIKHIHTYPFPVPPSHLSILIDFPPLHILTIIFLTTRVELVSQKLEIRLFFLLHLQTNPSVHLISTYVTE